MLENISLKFPALTLKIFSTLEEKFGCLCSHVISQYLFSFSLVFPNRTFFLCADTEQEMQEWIDLLKWKLVTSYF